MKSNTEFYKCPKGLQAYPDLTPTEKDVAMIIWSYHSTGLRCFMSNESIAKAIGGRSSRNVQRILAELEQKGMISKHLSGKKRHLIPTTRLAAIANHNVTYGGQSGRWMDDKTATSLYNRKDNDKKNYKGLENFSNDKTGATPLSSGIAQLKNSIEQRRGGNDMHDTPSNRQLNEFAQDVWKNYEESRADGGHTRNLNVNKTLEKFISRNCIVPHNDQGKPAFMVDKYKGLSQADIFQLWDKNPESIKEQLLMIE